MKYGSSQVNRLPPYLFSVFQQKKKELEARGMDIIDLGIGAPDLPTPPFIIERLIEEAKKPENHKYSPYGGCAEFKQAVASFYKRHYNVELDPDTEVHALIGSKEGIAHLIQAVLDPGDYVLLPDPGYPVYQSAVHLAYGVASPFKLVEEHGYIPQFKQIRASELNRAKLMLLNYPSNPTGATVEIGVFTEAVDFARKNKLSLIHDAAYDLVTFSTYKSPSILQVPGAKEVAVEFGSLSKSFNMAGWRLGYVVGNKDLIQALAVVKSNTDTSQFLAIQKAGAEALQSDLTAVKENNRIYYDRMKLMVNALQEMGLTAGEPRGTFFVWAKVPASFTSQSFAEKLLEEAGVIVTPGNAFGAGGEGYVRISLSTPVHRLREAVKRMKKMNGGGAP
ncbi:aminotransferase class I/II-fold pyridoxal phosphate-dependent enzyme [Halobacillus sp. Marseille-P3879]|uniref:aminotransferase class I/II-fold pyridoxal phosphate-dependent enzyme n=1 Tax=Halobacillus sp. Marseille-P3879 TaxID=2045014 RepID=UPI001F2C5523|nr:aminotransferase class I/II-fold pyridoxal phosphate-dependent enzyme [Halobacillus sp. Marseille-P3879]